MTSHPLFEVIFASHELRVVQARLHFDLLKFLLQRRDDRVLDEDLVLELLRSVSGGKNKRRTFVELASSFRLSSISSLNCLIFVKRSCRVRVPTWGRGCLLGRDERVVAF
jgi:hypothetical protein